MWASAVIYWFGTYKNTYYTSNFELSYASNTQGGVLLSQLHPCLEGVFDIEVKKTEIDEVAKIVTLCFWLCRIKPQWGLQKSLRLLM